MAEARRFTLSVPEDIATQVEELKRERFYDKPYAEIYRYLIELGIRATALVEPKKVE